MTLNYNKMKDNKNCIHLDVEKKAKLKVDVNNKILYANDYFLNITGYPIHEIILKDLDTVFHDGMPLTIQKMFLEWEDDSLVKYSIIKGKTKDSHCFWGLVRITKRLDEESELTGYLVEIKLLPNPAVTRIEKLFEVLREIEKNASVSAAQKYLKGYLEEKNLSFKDFIFNITEINEKKAEKYFSIDEDAKPKKKKKSWF